MPLPIRSTKSSQTYSTPAEGSYFISESGSASKIKQADEIAKHPYRVLFFIPQTDHASENAPTFLDHVRSLEGPALAKGATAHITPHSNSQWADCSFAR